MRRAERQLPREEALSVLAKGEYGVLSLCTPEGEAYGIPLSYAVWNDAVYFHCAPEGFKLECIRNNPRVSFCVVGDTEVLPADFSTNFESAVVSGRAVSVYGDEKREALLKLVEKYSPGYLPEGKRYLDGALEKTFVVKIAIDGVTGKARKPR